MLTNDFVAPFHGIFLGLDARGIFGVFCVVCSASNFIGRCILGILEQSRASEAASKYANNVQYSAGANFDQLAEILSFVFSFFLERFRLRIVNNLPVPNPDFLVDPMERHDAIDERLALWVPSRRAENLGKCGFDEL